MSAVDPMAIEKFMAVQAPLFVVRVAGDDESLRFVSLECVLLYAVEVCGRSRLRAT